MVPTGMKDVLDTSCREECDMYCVLQFLGELKRKASVLTFPEMGLLNICIVSCKNKSCGCIQTVLKFVIFLGL
jgi:hypothetical protein